MFGDNDKIVHNNKKWEKRVQQRVQAGQYTLSVDTDVNLKYIQELINSSTEYAMVVAEDYVSIIKK